MGTGPRAPGLRPGSTSRRGFGGHLRRLGPGAGGAHLDVPARPRPADGLSVESEETDLGLSNDSFWEGRIIEAPTVLLREGTFYLFFSANDFGGPDYAVGYATARDPLGPYMDAEENPILTTVPGALGPGHQAIVSDDDEETWMVYHAWDAGLIYRQVWIDRLVFEGDRPVVKGPTTGPQPIP